MTKRQNIKMDFTETFHFPEPTHGGQKDAFSIRVSTMNGAPWFVVADVCKALDFYMMPRGQANVTRALRCVDDDEVAFTLVKTNAANGGERSQQVTVVSESGLYKLILRAHPSNPRVKRFQDWVTKTVLPAIRKDGAYVMGEEKVRSGEMSEDELVLKAMNILNKKVTRLTSERDHLRGVCVLGRVSASFQLPANSM